MVIHNYMTPSGRDVIMEYIDGLTKAEQVDAFSVLECMEKGEFDQLICKRWHKKIYEVYFKKHNRIFYIIADREKIYLLHACRKQKNKTEKNDKNIVLSRAKELGLELGRNFL